VLVTYWDAWLQVAYLASGLFLDYKSDLIILVVNTLTQDLKSDNYLIGESLVVIRGFSCLACIISSLTLNGLRITPMRALFGRHLALPFASNVWWHLMLQYSQHWQHHVIARLNCQLLPSAKHPLQMDLYMCLSIPFCYCSVHSPGGSLQFDMLKPYRRCTASCHHSSRHPKDSVRNEAVMVLHR